MDLENKIYKNNKININRKNNFRSINHDYRIFRNNNPSYNNKILEEKLKTNVMNDKFYINELIEEINKMKISQQEANTEFQKK